jgi:hypothetical protein
LHHDQYFGQVLIPDGSAAVPFTSFHRAPHWRSRATIASRPLVAVDFGVVTAAVCAAGAVGV